MKLVFKTTAKLLLLSIICFSCNKDDSPRAGAGQINFSLSQINDTGRLLEGSLEDAVAIIITIETSEGESTSFDRETIDLFEINGQFISEKISLPTGAYRLTEFLVIDVDNNVTHIAPLEGSSQAQNVSNSLPMDFLVIRDEIIELFVEIISTEGLSAEDFGVVGFNLNEIPVFNFLINASEKGSFDTFLEASLHILADEYEFNADLSAISNNTISIKDGYENYDVQVIKEGFHDFYYTYSRDSLKDHSSSPLSIELEPIAIAGDDLIDERDGKNYKTVHIGEQLWMAENLRATLYNDGTAIDYPGTNISEWEENTTGAYAWYDHVESEFGPLYNWYAVNTGKLCPIGWHMPSDEEWDVLANYLGGSSVAGSKMKETGTDNWEAPNSDATNVAGFSALPAGWAYFSFGHFSYQGERAIFWSSDEGIDANHGISRHLRSGDSELIRYTSSNSSNKGNGFSCRCIKD